MTEKRERIMDGRILGPNWRYKKKFIRNLGQVLGSYRVLVDVVYGAGPEDGRSVVRPSIKRLHFF